MHKYANPHRFLRIANMLHPWLKALTIILFAVGLYLVFFKSPDDYQQGNAVLIMYIHVPAAWLSMFVYSTIAISSFVFLIWRHPLADIIARSSGMIGASFALITLITGAIWGKPMWGAWWVWDARLTSMLILFFFYVGYTAISRQAETDISSQKICAVLAIIGFINIPIVKFSVDWWATLHQPASIIRSGGVAIDSSMLYPLAIMGLAFMLFYVTLLIYELNSAMNSAKIKRLTSLYGT